MKQRETIIKLAAIAVLLVFALTSFFALADYATDADNYTHTIEAIDEKKAMVMGFTATAAAASTAIAAIPGDASTPIANQIMEISEYLFIVVCFLVLEKSLLTVLGFLACKILIPTGCVLLAVYVLSQKRSMFTLGLKLVVFAIVISMIIPFSVDISDMIYDANRATIEGISGEIELMDAPEETVPETTAPAEVVEEEKSWLEKLKDNATDAMDKLKDTATEAVDKMQTVVSSTGEEAKEILNKFIDAIALFIITYCAIPVIVVFVVIWLVKFLFSVTIPAPSVEHVKGLKRKLRREELQEPAEV
ncbi:MAG: hypothetical protein E7451_10715 [Ruminococcaceae bacterium]|nr:hypothetical protein [Oscillospiraceae bacterium]